MFRKIQFKFTKIKYSGKSIGDDIRIDIDILDKILRIDKKIKVGEVVKFNEEIGNFSTDQKSFVVKARIKIVEKDAIFNDVGSVKKKINIDDRSTNHQKFVYVVELRENRFWKNWGRLVAKFEITIEAFIFDLIKYIPDVSNGWLKVKIVGGDIVSLPSFLKVRSEYIERGREYFTMLEGHYKNQRASSSLDDKNNSRLLTDVAHKPLIYLKHSINKKLIIENKEYEVADYSKSPWDKGLYDIELPDYPHPKGRNYENKSIRSMSWFRIGHIGERYLHTGNHSLGCITMTEVERWDEIYDKLIKARKGDFLSVGMLEIVD